MPLRFATALCLLVILSAVTFAADKKPAADNSAQLQAKVVYGAAAEQQQRADIDLWISKAVAKCGSPVAQPQTGWIALTGESKRLHSGNGFYIDGKVTEKEGQYEVEIEGCNGGSLDQKATLKPGERRIVNLSGIPGPDNIFVALEAPVSEQAKERSEAMKADAKNFSLDLQYNGEQGKPFYRLTVSVPVVERRRSSSFEQIVQVKEAEAIKIIDHLARDGFFDRAHISGKLEKLPQPCYLLTVHAGDLDLTEIMGWGLPMIHRLDAFRTVLPDHGKKDMDFLLGRLSGWRAKWEAENPPFEAKVGREGSKVRFVTEDDKTIIDITSEFGIDNATISRKLDKWPKAILVRLHLSGLESFKASSGNVAVEWSVASTGDHATRSSLVSGLRVAEITKGSPYFAEVRIVGGNGKIPLNDGYFEVALPSKLFEGNSEEITLRWIEFYRN